MKKTVSILLVLIMIFTAVPLTVFSAEAESVRVFVSDDSKFILGIDGSPVANAEVPLGELEKINLDDYGLGYYGYDGDGDGEYDITALQLFIYIHEILLGRDFSEVGVSGGPGSMYFYGNLFGFDDENLRYDYNGSYPAVDGIGLTVDRIVLNDGDFLNIAHYSDWAFWGDSATGFHYFTDEYGSITHTYFACENDTLNVGLVRGYSDWDKGGAAAFAPEEGYEVSYGREYGNPEGTVTTDGDGYFEISFPSEGVWYLWADGAFGTENEDAVVSSPAFATVNINKNPDLACAEAVEALISAIGEVSSESRSKIENARAAYDKLTDKQKELVKNYGALLAAEKELENTDIDKEAAGAVEEKIAKIGEPTIFSSNKITEARKAFDSLTERQKSYVRNIGELLAAEEKLNALYSEASNANHKAIYEQTGKYINALGTPNVGSVGGEWMVIGLTRSGYACPEGYCKNVVDYVNAKINENEQLHRAKSTDNSRVILALTSAGYDVTDVGGHNLLMGLTDMDYVTKQGINGPVWALIAFDCHGYEIPDNPNAAQQVSREILIDFILEKQLEDGGWALSGKAADTDITAMALQALAPYYNTDERVKTAADKAVKCLSDKQYGNGGFGSVDGVCSESCAQVIVALTALGINPETDERFVKNGVSVVDAMCLFAVDGGGFSHIPNGDLNGMATEQGQYALAAYFRFIEGKTALYDMSDVEIGSDVLDTSDEDAVKEVEKLISEIGVVTKDSAEAIEAARTAYDALTDTQKAMVKNYSELTEAEAQYARLINEQEETDNKLPEGESEATPDTADKVTETEPEPETNTDNNNLENNNTVNSSGVQKNVNSNKSLQKTENPKTGADGNITALNLLSLVSLFAAMICAVCINKKRKAY